MKKQNGFLLYIPAWNTSKIDPVTGFVNFLDTNYKNKEESQEFFRKFDSICYNKEKNWFEFKFNYEKFTQKANETRTEWTLCSVGDRIETFRNKQKNLWKHSTVNLTEELKKLFGDSKIDIKSDNLKEQIVKQDSKDFFKELLRLLRLTLQMRNSNSDEKVDYIISPVADKNGNFYDSRCCCNNLPKDADANGAYNIARKGLWMIRQIKKSEKPNLAMTNKEWLAFVQEKPYLKD